MALIRCDECAREVSDRAVACPHCGNPIGAAARVQTIEATSKKWKAMQIRGGALFIVGMSVMIWRAAQQPDTSLGLDAVAQGAGVAGMMGFVLVVSGRVGAWWHHG